MPLAREPSSANSASSFTALPILQACEPLAFPSIFPHVLSYASTSEANCAVDGFKREVYLINGQQPGPLIDVDEGDDVEIFVQNDLNVETTIHWHG